MGTGFSPLADTVIANRAATRALRLLRLAPVALAALLAAAPARADEPVPEPLERLPQAALSIESAGAAHHFRVWVADTDARRNRGLMFVKSLAANRGMVFAWPVPQVASFWMKNTLIPLDLLFVGLDGRVIRVVENAVPHSLATITSMGLVTGVIELAGGSAARLGIQPGDRVHCRALASGSPGSRDDSVPPRPSPPAVRR